jgi:hypothetical protein
MLERENLNDFVQAELAIATLKCLSQKKPAGSPQTAAQAWKEAGTPSYIFTEDNVLEMEPLVIKPPRVFIAESERIGQSINNKLLALIRGRLDAKLSPRDQQDPNYQNLLEMKTPMGLALQTRYSELSILVAEGLGGVREEFLRSELINMARFASNPTTRATALLSLSYAKKNEDVTYIMEALVSEDPVVRFGGMEAMIAGGFKEALPSITNVIYFDAVPAFRIFAMRILAAFGDPSGRDLLLSNFQNTDWPSRSMSFWYTGLYGLEADQRLLMERIPTESNPFCQAELALGVNRLAKVE